MDRHVNPDTVVREVLETTRTIAILGASLKPARPSHYVMEYLVAKGYRCIPVNPGVAGKTILGQTVYARLADIPEPVDMVDVFRASDAVAGIVDEVLALPARPNAIWLQLGIRDDAAADRAEAAGVAVVRERCPKIEIPRLFGPRWPGAA
jgi:predicted CoA-binding protein